MMASYGPGPKLGHTGCPPTMVSSKIDVRARPAIRSTTRSNSAIILRLELAVPSTASTCGVLVPVISAMRALVSGPSSGAWR